MADIAASVLAKLRNKAKASGISYQQCLQLFVQEEFLRKLSKSGCEDTLILKGGLFIYTLTNFESIRDARNMVVHNGGRIYKEFDKYDKFKIGYREEDHQLYLEYNDIVKMYDAILDFMDRTFRIIPQG